MNKIARGIIEEQRQYRDTGAAIHFSAWDEKAKNLARKMAQVKWDLAVERNGKVLKKRDDPVQASSIDFYR